MSPFWVLGRLIGQRDPVAEVLADRGRYVAAALTVVRGYFAAGRPDPAPRLASFEGWSDTVRSALIWLGRPDPVETMETARRDDPNLQAMEAVFAALKDAIGVGEDRAISAAENCSAFNRNTGRFECVRSVAISGPQGSFAYRSRKTWGHRRS